MVDQYSTSEGGTVPQRGLQAEEDASSSQQTVGRSSVKEWSQALRGGGSPPLPRWLSSSTSTSAAQAGESPLSSTVVEDSVHTASVEDIARRRGKRPWSKGNQHQRSFTSSVPPTSSSPAPGAVGKRSSPPMRMPTPITGKRNTAPNLLLPPTRPVTGVEAERDRAEGDPDPAGDPHLRARTLSRFSTERNHEFLKSWHTLTDQVPLLLLLLLRTKHRPLTFFFFFSPQ